MAEKCKHWMAWWQTVTEPLKRLRLPGVVAKARSNFWLVQLFEILYDRHMLQVTTAARVCAKALQWVKLLLARTSGHWHSAFNVRAVLLSNTFPGWIKAGMTERRHLKNPLAKAQNRKYRWYLLVSALDTQSKFLKWVGGARKSTTCCGKSLKSQQILSSKQESVDKHNFISKPHKYTKSISGINNSTKEEHMLRSTALINTKTNVIVSSHAPRLSHSNVGLTSTLRPASGNPIKGEYWCTVSTVTTKCKGH